MHGAGQGLDAIGGRVAVAQAVRLQHVTAGEPVTRGRELQRRVVQGVHGVEVHLRQPQHGVRGTHLGVLQRELHALQDGHRRGLVHERQHQAASGAAVDGHGHVGLERQGEGPAGAPLRVADEVDARRVEAHLGARGRDVGRDLRRLQGLHERQVVGGRLVQVAARGLGVREVVHEGFGREVAVSPFAVHDLVIAEHREPYGRAPLVDLRDQPRQSLRDVTAERSPGSVRVQNQGPAGLGHRETLRHRERHAHQLVGDHVSLFAVEANVPPVGGRQIGSRPVLEHRQGYPRVHLVEVRVVGEATANVLLTGEPVVAGRARARHARGPRGERGRRSRVDGAAEAGQPVANPGRGEHRSTDEVGRADPGLRHPVAEGPVGLPGESQVVVGRRLRGEHGAEVGVGRERASGHVAARGVFRSGRPDPAREQHGIRGARGQGAGPRPMQAQAVGADVPVSRGRREPAEIGLAAVVGRARGEVHHAHGPCLARRHHGLRVDPRGRAEHDRGVGAPSRHVVLNRVDEPRHQIDADQARSGHGMPREIDATVGAQPRIVGERQAVKVGARVARAGNLEVESLGAEFILARHARRALEERRAEERAGRLARAVVAAAQPGEAVGHALTRLAHVGRARERARPREPSEVAHVGRQAVGAAGARRAHRSVACWRAHARVRTEEARSAFDRQEARRTPHRRAPWLALAGFARQAVAALFLGRARLSDALSSHDEHVWGRPVEAAVRDDVEIHGARRHGDVEVARERAPSGQRAEQKQARRVQCETGDVQRHGDLALLEMPPRSVEPKVGSNKKARTEVRAFSHALGGRDSNPN